MKKLFYPLLLLFLFSSSAVYARTVMSPKLEIKGGCHFKLKDLQTIADSAKDIQLVTKGCKEDNSMEYQWKLKYLLTPTQKFSIKMPKDGGVVICEKLARSLNTEYSNEKVRFHAKCVDIKKTKFAGMEDGPNVWRGGGARGAYYNAGPSLSFVWGTDRRVVLKGKIEVMTKRYAKKFKVSPLVTTRLESPKYCKLIEAKLLEVFGDNQDIKVLTKGCNKNVLSYKWITRGSKASTKREIQGHYLSHRDRKNALEACSALHFFLRDHSGMNTKIQCDDLRDRFFDIGRPYNSWFGEIKVKMQHRK